MRDHVSEAVLGLGSNMGDKVANIDKAVAMLCSTGDIRLKARSRYHRTAPWGVTDQDWFVNACIQVITRLSPRELLERCQEVESLLGRVRRRHWGPRTIDVDILDYDGISLNEPDLILPHPRIAERAFVLVPLAEIAPRLMIKGAAVSTLLAITNTAGVEVFDDHFEPRNTEPAVRDR
jgi:2-amino-4-hydroxy-6-hydroxymethyldihydropteridine diphosphokinase